MPIKMRVKGNLGKTRKFLDKMNSRAYLDPLEHLGETGVRVLADATPKDTGKTSESWEYEIHRSDGLTEIIWTNSNINDGRNVAILIQYGHGTRNGGFVRGVDYINPAMRPIFLSIADAAWKVVKDS